MSNHKNGGEENSVQTKKKKFPWLALFNAIKVIGDIVIDLIDKIKKDKKDKPETRALSFRVQEELDKIPVHLPPFEAKPIPRHLIAQGETLPYHLAKLGVLEAWELGTGATGKGIKVGIVDTGIDLDHEDIPNVAAHVSFVSSEPDGNDLHGHGTWCAGDVAAIMGNAKGVAGIAPEVELYAIKVLSQYGSGTLLGVVKAIDWAIENELDILSMSLGASSGHSSLEDAIKRATDAGLIIVAAAGNDGRETLSYPAAYPDVIAVGSLNKEEGKSNFSNSGAGIDTASFGESILGLWKNNGYATVSGTSMATPNVTGLLAAYMSKHGKLTPAGVVQLLEKWAKDLGEKGYDLEYGHGLLTADVWQTEEEPEPPNPEPPKDDEKKWIEKNWLYLLVGAALVAGAVYLITKNTKK